MTKDEDTVCEIQEFDGVTQEVKPKISGMSSQMQRLRSISMGKSSERQDTYGS